MAAESTLNFNGTTSTADARVTLDGLGRTSVSQRRQGQGSANYDSVQTKYDSSGRVWESSAPYSGTAGAASGSVWTSTTYDALNRPTQVTDAGGGWTKYTYNQNDVYVEVGPLATGDANTKKRQLEYDGLGRLTSVCEISSASGSGSCGQNVTQTGFWTKYTYDALNNLLTVTQNAQSGSKQTRTFTYDGLGRLTSEKTPETNQAAYNYTFDTDGTCGTLEWRPGEARRSGGGRYLLCLRQPAPGDGHHLQRRVYDRPEAFCLRCGHGQWYGYDQCEGAVGGSVYRHERVQDYGLGL